MVWCAVLCCGAMWCGVVWCWVVWSKASQAQQKAVDSVLLCLRLVVPIPPTQWQSDGDDGEPTMQMLEAGDSLESSMASMMALTQSAMQAPTQIQMEALFCNISL